jgi:hypothetical protein
MFLAGYLFKETHTDVHYVREGYGQRGDDYRVNFTEISAEALEFPTQEKALNCVMDLMADFEPDQDYRWTPVTIDLDTGRSKKIMDTRWHT